jgi:outer membrane protein TolC
MMQHRLIWLILAAAVFSTPRLCHGQSENAHTRRITSAGSVETNIVAPMNITINATESAEAKRQRDVVMPKLPEIFNDKRLQGYLEPIKKILAQANVGLGTQSPETNSQNQGERLELTLNKSLEIALKNNLDIRIAELTKEAVETTVPTAKARFHPTVGLAFTGSGVKDVTEGKILSESNAQDGTVFIQQQLPTGTGANLILTGNLFRIKVDNDTFLSDMGVTIVQPLFRGGGVVVATREISDAEADVRIEAARVRKAILDVVAQTKSAYYTLLLAEKIISVTQEAIQRDKALLEASQALLNAGFVTKRDVFSAELSLATDSATLVSDLANMESAKNGLLEVLGIPIGTNIALLDKDIALQPVSVDLPTWIARATKNRPEILEIEQQVAKSDLNIKVAKNTVLPQVDLVGSYKKAQAGSTLGNSLDLRGHAWSVGVVLSYPIWNVAAKSELAKAEIEHKRLGETLQKTKRQIELEVRSSVIKVNRSLERIKPLRVSLEQANGKLEIAKARFALGQTTNFDITDAQEAIVTAETDLLRAIVDYNIGLAELEARIAGTL